MVSIEGFRNLVLSFKDVEEKPHFHLASFRVMKKIFATLWAKEKRVMLKLPVVEQSVFCSYDNTIFFPVPGGWGNKGATFVDLQKVKAKILKEALTIAYKAITQNERKSTKK